MRRDKALLDAVAQGTSPPTLRFYAWSPPAISLGRFQSEDEIDLSICRQRGWDVVRRPTGGRAVLHDREITFSIVVPLALVAHVGVLPSYCLFTSALNRALAGLHPALKACGTESGGDGPGSAASETRFRRRVLRTKGGMAAPASCFAVPSAADSLVAGRKLVGAAQVRRNGALLQHGSILLEVDRQAWRELFGEVGELVTLRELLPELPPVAEIVERIACGFAAALGIELVPDSDGAT